ncbi:hypothetical protein VKT23_009828 [Stygiomarasmius scandens]|uniref:Mid2 domain-containing protein n=1 Tax=Marasmiellus scandens TaxID=2682957 RepID=A0ABR1JI48_9AGAR
MCRSLRLNNCRSFLSVHLSQFLTFITFLTFVTSASCFKISAPTTATAGAPVAITWFRDPGDQAEFGLLELQEDARLSTIAINNPSPQGTVGLTFGSPGQFGLRIVDQSGNQINAGPQIDVGPENVVEASPVVTSTISSTKILSTITTTLSTSPMILPNSQPTVSSSSSTETTTTPLIPTDTSSTKVSSSTSSSSSSSTSTTSSTSNKSTSEPETIGPSSTESSSSQRSSFTDTSTSSSSVSSPSAEPSAEGSSQSHSHDHDKIRLAIILSVILAAFISGILFWVFVVRKQRYATKRRLDMFQGKLAKMGLGWMVGTSRGPGGSTASDSESFSALRDSTAYANTSATRSVRSGPSLLMLGQENAGNRDPNSNIRSATGSIRSIDRTERGTIKSNLSTYSLGFGNWSSHVREREERDTQIFMQDQSSAIEEGRSDEAFGGIGRPQFSGYGVPFSQSFKAYPFVGSGSTNRGKA